MTNRPNKDEISKFSMMIDELALNLRCGIIDAIVLHCQKTGLEIEVASTLVSSSLKSKIKEEAEEMNLLKKESKLPI